MKTAIISDIHGNYPALLAVIEDARRNWVDRFIFAGDYIFDLPYPNEVTEVLRGLDNEVVIQGNKEGYLDRLSEENQQDWDLEQFGAVYQTFRELSPENITYLAGLEKETFVSLPHGGRVYVTHYIKELIGDKKKTECSSAMFRKEMEREPFSHADFLKSADCFLKEEHSIEVLGKINAEVIVFGHSHLQWHGYCGDKLIINPGSCGQPLDFNTDAAYTILEDSESGFSVTEKRVSYDIEETISYSKDSEICKAGRVWCELVFKAIRTGRDVFSSFFEIAYEVAAQRDENDRLFSNEIWNIAAERYGL